MRRLRDSDDALNSVYETGLQQSSEAARRALRVQQRAYVVDFQALIAHGIDIAGASATGANIAAALHER